MAWRKLAVSALVMALAAPVFSNLPGCGMFSQRSAADAAPPAFSSLPDLHEIGLEQKWQRHLQLHGGEHITNAWRVNKSVYVATDHTRIFRIDSLTGVLAFAEELSTEHLNIFRPAEFRLDPSLPNRELLVTTRAQSFVLDKRNGDILRSADLPVSTSCTPVVANGTMCVGGANVFMGMFLDQLAVLRWKIQMENTDLFLSTPVVVENTLIVATKTGRIMRLGGNDGDWIWKDRKTNGDVRAGLAADGRAVYVPCLDKKLYAFNVETGSELWQAPLDGVLDKTPAMAGSVVMIPSTGMGLYAVTRKTGANRWFVPGISNILTTTDDHTWVGDEGGNLKSIKFETGEILQSAHIDDLQIFVRNPDDDQVILVARSGAVSAYEPVQKEQ